MPAARQFAVDRTLDVRDRTCPGPLMALVAAMKDASEGELVAVWTPDPTSLKDIPAWVEKSGHRLVGVFAGDGYDEIVVEKAG
jgi:tRNA 2-thiouridine synthesizing protein A